MWKRHLQVVAHCPWTVLFKSIILFFENGPNYTFLILLYFFYTFFALVLFYTFFSQNRWFDTFFLIFFGSHYHNWALIFLRITQNRCLFLVELFHNCKQLHVLLFKCTETHSLFKRYLLVWFSQKIFCCVFSEEKATIKRL